MAAVREGDWTCTACSNLNYANRQVCNRCSGPKSPPASENSRPGDWMCPACSNHNYAKRQACNKCSTLKPGLIAGLAGNAAMKGVFSLPGIPGLQVIAPQLSGLTTGAAPTGNFRPGDWSCVKCGNHNYSSRDKCNKCAGPKTAGENVYAAFKGAGPTAARFSPYLALPQGGKGGLRPGDWICPGCSNHNYASREQCNKCNRSKNMPANFREGDWLCSKCSNHNYANKQACNRCQEPRVPA